MKAIILQCLKKFLIITLFTIGSLPQAYAQQGRSATGPVYGDPMSDLALVGWGTLGGAILGLSTLSFTDEPGDHLKNIWVGGAIGLIIGVGIVAYLQANTSNTYYQEDTPPPPANYMQGFHRTQWNDESAPSAKASLSQISYSFRF